MSLEPITREEKFLAKAAGQNVEVPEPVTRKEQFLKAIAENGGSGGGDETPGVGISRIELTKTEGLVDTYTIFYTNGDTYVYTVTNGAKGDKGDKGETGATGPQGPVGDKGDKGDSGKSAYEYAKEGGYTGSEAEFSAQMAFLMGYSVYGYVDENNNVIIRGDISDGSYISYIKADGSTVYIGQLSLDNNIYYTVTNNLTNCTSNNGETQAVGGSGYAAVISANSGYELSSVTVTMGDSDITSSAVNGGSINIENVTGNIVITAMAEEVSIEIVNRIPLSTDTDGSVYNGIGYKTGVRINGSGEVVSGSGVSSTGFIPVSVGDKVYMKGLNFTDNSGYTKIAHYGSDKNHVAVEPKQVFPNTWTNEGNGVYSYTIVNESASYIRVASYHTMDGNEVITINQPIV